MGLRIQVIVAIVIFIFKDNLCLCASTSTHNGHINSNSPETEVDFSELDKQADQLKLSIESLKWEIANLQRLKKENTVQLACLKKSEIERKRRYNLTLLLGDWQVALEIAKTATGLYADQFKKSFNNFQRRLVSKSFVKKCLPNYVKEVHEKSRRKVAELRAENEKLDKSLKDMLEAAQKEIAAEKRFAEELITVTRTDQAVQTDDVNPSMIPSGMQIAKIATAMTTVVNYNTFVSAILATICAVLFNFLSN